MTWARVDDGFWRHEKIAGVSDAALGLHLRALSYCCDQLTDGKLSKPALTMLGAKPSQVRELVMAGIWDEGPVIHDFLEYNESRVEVLDKREKAKLRMRGARSPSTSKEVRANTTGTSGEVQSTFADPVPTRPDPSQTRPVESPPSPPQAGGTRERRRERGLKGSQRQRDVAELSVEERYLGRRAG